MEKGKMFLMEFLVDNVKLPQMQIVPKLPPSHTCVSFEVNFYVCQAIY